MTPLKQQAIQTALAGDWQNAILFNENLLAEEPLDIETLNRLAFAYAIVGKIKEAKKTYQKVLEIDKLNPIAIRNIKRLNKTVNTKQTADASSPSRLISNMFLEENGKTKVVELINIAQPNILANLRIGQLVHFSPKRLKIFVLDENKQYLGMLPEDIGRRITKFLSGGNIYESYVKAAGDKKIIIFIKEIKRTTRFKDQPTFLYVTEKIQLSFEKNSKEKITKPKKKGDEKNHALGSEVREDDVDEEDVDEEP